MPKEAMMNSSMFSDCKRPITAKDFALIEQDLMIKIPEDLKSIYSECNGGTPERTIWVDDDGHWDDIELGRFLPMLYDDDNAGEQRFTVENVARIQWMNNALPKNLLPIAIDWGANFFCIDHQTGKIYYFVRDVWSDNISTEKNFEINTRYLTDSLSSFLNGLVHSEEGA